jgi:hypothetical protein
LTIGSNKTLCLAPWVHTYLSPQTERRMCCASREPAQNFQQYIDTKSGTGNYIPITLEQHWNSDHMRGVRTRMMAGQTLPECEVCNDQLLNTDVYRSYFNQMFAHLRDQAISSTTSDGYTSMQPVSWDYRFSNLCNFKCRMCGDMLSSAWESEQRAHNSIDWSDAKNNWMQPAIRQQITDFQNHTVEQEFAQAVEEHRIEEVYWVGGEPLMYEQHWRYMRRIIELGDGGRLYARYNTNLSRVDYRGANLYRDILSHVRDWQICASLDGTGQIGEYIRTGLNYESWLHNFTQGVDIAKHRRQMRIDFTLTLPGMFEIKNIQQLGHSLGVDILSKVVFSFSPDIVMSPLALPKDILHPWIDEILIAGVDQPLKDTLVQLRTRPTFQEQYGQEEYRAGMIRGKQRLLDLERIRLCNTSMAKILSARPQVLAWWNSI